MISHTRASWAAGLAGGLALSLASACGSPTAEPVVTDPEPIEVDRGGGGGEEGSVVVRHQDLDQALAARTRGLFLAADEELAPQVVESAFLTLKVVEGSGSMGRQLQPGATLRTGDRFHMVVETAVPAYVYVMYVDPIGEPHLLLPSEGDGSPVQPGNSVRVPPAGTSIQLDDETGVELLYVIGARRPLSELGGDTLAVLDSVRAGSGLPEFEQEGETPTEEARRTRAVMLEEKQGPDGAVMHEEEADVPGIARMRTRGVQMVDDENKIVSTADEDGVAVIEFPIRHVD